MSRSDTNFWKLNLPANKHMSSKMPPKQPKESVVYPSSKRKTPAFKPLRPSKVPRIPTTESESSVKSRPAAKKAPPRKPAAQSIPLESSDEDDNDLADLAKDDDSDTLGEDPLAASKKKPQPKTAANTASTTRRPSIRAHSPMSISSEHHDDPPDATTSNTLQGDDPIPTQSDATPSIPQALLLRLLHEGFANKNTKIDTQAIQVFHKYVEVFVREAIARTKAEKDEAAERGEVATQSDVGWLEIEDLEKAAPGLTMDFL